MKYDIDTKYRKCIKCGDSKPQLVMCLDTKSAIVSFEKGDWYCEKCYKEIMKKRGKSK